MTMASPRAIRARPRLFAELDVPVSIDTMKAPVMRALNLTTEETITDLNWIVDPNLAYRLSGDRVQVDPTQQMARIPVVAVEGRDEAVAEARVDVFDVGIHVANDVAGQLVDGLPQVFPFTFLGFQMG